MDTAHRASRWNDSGGLPCTLVSSWSCWLPFLGSSFATIFLSVHLLSLPPPPTIFSDGCEVFSVLNVILQHFVLFRKQLLQNLISHSNMVPEDGQRWAGSPVQTSRSYVEGHPSPAPVGCECLRMRRPLLLCFYTSWLVTKSN